MKIDLVKAGLNPELDNSVLINRTIEMAPDKSTLVFGDGRFPISETIVQDRKTINWEGSDDTTFIPTQPMVAARFIGGSRSFRVSRINFHGDYSIWTGDKGPTFNCVEIEAVIRMEDCHIRNWWGTGIHVSADVQRTPPVDASHCRFDTLKIWECKNHGMFFRGGDANQINCYHIDVRDNRGTGIWDNSFLGCQFYGAMAHHNGRNYAATDANNRTHFFGCYSEGGKKLDLLDGHARWYGINSSGVEVHGKASFIQGNYVSSAQFGLEAENESLIRLDQQGMHFDRFGTTNGLKLKQVTPMSGGYPHYTMAHFHRIFEFFGAWPDAPTKYQERDVTFASFGMTSMFIGSRLFAEARPDDPRFKGFEFKYGDTLINPDFDGENESEWVFTKNGWVAYYSD